MATDPSIVQAHTDEQNNAHGSDDDELECVPARPQYDEVQPAGSAFGDQGSAMRSLANSLLANAETRIVYRQESGQLEPTATALGLTGTEQLLHPDELALFDTTARMA